MKNNGVGYGKISTRAQASWRKALAGVRLQIATGKIKVTQQSPPAYGYGLCVYRKGRVSIPPLPV